MVSSVTCNFKAGSCQKVDMWKKLTSDKWILMTIKEYKIDFVRTPVNSFIPKVIDFGFERNKMVDQEVQDLLANAAISECEHENGEFISNIFLANKKGGKFRPGMILFYQFNCLCFGISCAPRVFTKLMKVIFAHIRRMGISSFYYIDDSSLCK